MPYREFRMVTDLLYKPVLKAFNFMIRLCMLLNSFLH